MKSKMRVFAEDHATEILTGVGVVGMVGTTVLAVKATPKALMLIEDRKDELETESLDHLELVKTTWRCYVPATAVGVLSISCLIGSAGVNAKRSAALAAACTLSENAFRTYAEKTLEVVGQEKEHEIREFVGRQKIKDKPMPENTSSLYICEEGESVVFEGSSGRYFKSSMNAIERAENAFNKQMLEEMTMSLNDYYYALGLDSVSIGDVIGWDLEDGMIEFKVGSILSDDGKPCIYLEPGIQPRHDFRDRYR